MVWSPTDSTSECLRMGERDGAPYEEMACVYQNTLLGKTYMDWEFNVEIHPIWSAMVAHPWIPLVACVVYGLAIVAGQRFFATRSAWNLRRCLAAWNLFLALFSAWGFLRMAPLLVHNMTHYSMRDNLCEKAVSVLGTGTNGMWTMVFVLSKFAELFDTFFIVVRKKRLMFLHWYHHITVLLACWHAFVTETPAGYIFCTMNYGVHSVMYFYYFLMAAKCKPKWFSPVVITGMQIMQMVVGVFVSTKAFQLLRLENQTKVNCHANLENIGVFVTIYGTYLLLFSQFFLKRYVVRTAVIPKQSPRAAKKLL